MKSLIILTLSLLASLVVNAKLRNLNCANNNILYKLRLNLPNCNEPQNCSGKDATLLLATEYVDGKLVFQGENIECPMTISGTYYGLNDSLVMCFKNTETTNFSVGVPLSGLTLVDFSNDRQSLVCTDL